MRSVVHRDAGQRQLRRDRRVGEPQAQARAAGDEVDRRRVARQQAAGAGGDAVRADRQRR